MLHVSSTTNTSRSALAVKNLTVHFPSLGRDTNAAIDDLSFTVNPGEIVGLVGESGAGKTVLARSLLGLPPRPGRITSGQIFFGDQDLLSLGEKEQRKRRGSEISMIVPNPRNELNPLIPVGNQIATMLQVHRGIPLKQALAGALEMLRAVQIPDPLARMQALPQELSGGMAQRIVIAMALVCRPQFIVSDDATSGLDVTVQAQILELLQKLVRENNSSMLFITRDIGIAAHFCDRVAVLYRGKIMEIAPRDAFFLRPSNPTTIMLMTAFSHNQKLRSLWAPTKAGNSHLPQSGCVYADRCPLAQEICRSQAPELRDISRGQMTRCHFPVIR